MREPIFKNYYIKAILGVFLSFLFGCQPKFPLQPSVLNNSISNKFVILKPEFDKFQLSPTQPEQALGERRSRMPTLVNGQIKSKLKGQSTDISIYGRKDPEPNKAILPANFKVYVRDNVVVNVSYPGFEEKTLPTVNEFIGYPGCYVAAYSRRKEKSVYSVGGGIYVMGQVRAPGSYQGRICLPVGYEKVDISADFNFKLFLAKVLPSACEEGCWAGGDTGGWFGIQ
jgi:hypothetical protein